MSDLKPCPFCGGPATHIKLNHVIGCVPCATWVSEDRKDVWQRRTQPEADPQPTYAEWRKVVSLLQKIISTVRTGPAIELALQCLDSLDAWSDKVAASQKAAEPVATKWAIYYDNLGEQPYTSGWMSEWHLYNSEEEARAQIAHFTFSKHYAPRKVEVFMAGAALASSANA